MLLRARSVPTLLAAVACLAVWGCGSSSPTGPNPVTQEVADDIAVQMAASTGGSEGGVGAEFQMFSVAFPTGPAPESVSRATSSGDTTITVGAITYQISYTFLDEAGNPLPDWSPQAVRLIWDSRTTGDVTTTRWSASLRRSSSFDIDGIHALRDTLIVDGTVRDTIQSQFTSLDSTRTRYLYTQAALALADVAALKDHNINPYPLSGTLTWSVLVHRLRSNNLGDVEATFTAQATVVFNGTRYPTVTVAGTYRYAMDLVTGAVVRLPA